MLSRTSVSDEGISRLVEAPNLWHLHLGGLEFTNDALESVAKLRGLESLTIGYYTNVNDNGLIHLLGLRHLDTLRLEGTNFTDDVVKYIVAMRSLKKLILSSTSITADGIDQLRQDLPELEIEVTEGVAEDVLPGRQRIFSGC